MSLNFDQKIFWFPESYNRLRDELFTHWNPRKTGEQPHHKICKVRWDFWKCGWAMAFEAETFVEYMQTELDNPIKILTATQNDTMRIDVICAAFLKELRKHRGESNP